MNMDRAVQLKESWDIDMVDMLKQMVTDWNDQWSDLHHSVYQYYLREIDTLESIIYGQGEKNSYDNNHRGRIEALRFVLKEMDLEAREAEEE